MTTMAQLREQSTKARAVMSQTAVTIEWFDDPTQVRWIVPEPNVVGIRDFQPHPTLRIVVPSVGCYGVLTKTRPFHPDVREPRKSVVAWCATQGAAVLEAWPLLDDKVRVRFRGGDA